MPLLVIAGPTASGKSKLALELAAQLAQQGHKPEILCADSITVYRGFTIGAAKPSAEDQARFPHHLLDLADPQEVFTAGDFVRHALPLTQALLNKNHTPILVGGTGFYLRALLKGMASDEEEDPARALQVRKKLEARAAAEGWQSLHQELLQKDPGSAPVIHANDHYRILRGLQAMELSGRPWSELNRAARAAPPRFPGARYFCLRWEKEDLQKRVEARTQTMLDHGLVEEVQGLLQTGVPSSAKPMQSVGYKECLAYLEGAISREGLAPEIARATMKLVKSQLTWFRGEKDVEWIAPDFLPHILHALANPT